MAERQTQTQTQNARYIDIFYAFRVADKQTYKNVSVNKMYFTSSQITEASLPGWSARVPRVEDLTACNHFWRISIINFAIC